MLESDVFEFNLLNFNISETLWYILLKLVEFALNKQ